MGVDASAGCENLGCARRRPVLPEPLYSGFAPAYLFLPINVNTHSPDAPFRSSSPSMVLGKPMTCCLRVQNCKLTCDWEDYSESQWQVMQPLMNSNDDHPWCLLIPTILCGAKRYMLCAKASNPVPQVIVSVWARLLSPAPLRCLLPHIEQYRGSLCRYRGPLGSCPLPVYILHVITRGIGQAVWRERSRGAALHPCGFLNSARLPSP